MADSSHAVFLSYASEDAEAAGRICEALHVAGIEVWFDKSELRGGDVWDRQIREQIHRCRLFVPIISASTEGRSEGYFRREWKLAVDRTHDMSERTAFLVPVVIDATSEAQADVPEAFRSVQWMHLPGGEATPAFAARVVGLLGAERSGAIADRPSPLPGKAPLAHTRNHRALWTVIAVGVLAIAIGGGWLVSRQTVLRRSAESAVVSQSGPVVTEKSIAVLPFIDLTEKHDQEYFADGMAEEILTLLAKIPGLKVIGRTSSFQFKGKTDDLRKVGAALGANYVLEGSVRRSGDRLRVTAQLIYARDGTHRWSQTYDRSATDALAVQDEIATSLALMLEVEVGAGVHPRARPRNQEAYDYFLRGLRANQRVDEQGFTEALADFQHALDADPAFAPAAEARAWVLFGLAEFGYVLEKKGFPEAREAALAALKLDPKASGVHALLARIYLQYDWDWPATERELKLAQEFDPKDPNALSVLALYRMSMGQWPEASRLFDAILASDPLASGTYMLRQWMYQRAGRPTEAEASGRRVLEIAPTYAWAHYYLATSLLADGKSEAALAEMQKETVSEARDSGLVLVYCALNRKKDAEAALARLAADQLWPMGFAYAYTALGRNDQAFESLEEAYDTKDAGLWLIKGDPLLKTLEQDHRYKAFLRKMNLPE